MTAVHETIQSIKSILAGLLDTFTVKFVPAVAIPSLSFLFGFEHILSLQALLVLVAIDFLTGIFSAKIAGEVIQSKKAVKSAFKVAIYGLLMSAAHLTETIAPGTTFMVETMATFLALTELISVLENVGKMGFAVPKRLLNKLHEWRDEEIYIKEVATTHTIRDNNANTVETNKVVEKTEEKHTKEPLG